MALIKFGGGVVQMSGSIAGNTYARNRYGNYVRARTKPVNPKTDRQSVIRTAMQLLTTRWAQTLTAAQRTAWNLYASNVNMTNFTGDGHSHTMRLGVNIGAVGARDQRTSSTAATGTTDNTNGLPPYHGLAYIMEL